MPKHFSAVDRAKWLALLEEGKTESHIANNSKIDLRTIKTGIAQARRDRDLREARVSLIRDALKRHQEQLLGSLRDINDSIKVPQPDLEVISWHEGDGISIFLAEDEARKRFFLELFPEKSRKPSSLFQHLGKGRLWRLLAKWQEVYQSQMIARLELQFKTKSLIMEKTGLPIVSKAEQFERPFIYSYTACHLFYQYALKNCLAAKDDSDIFKRITADKSEHRIMLFNSTLGEFTGDEDGSLPLLLEAYTELKASPELDNVSNTYKELSEMAKPLKELINEYMVLGLLPGNCSICERIGI